MLWALHNHRPEFVELFVPLVNVCAFLYADDSKNMHSLLYPNSQRSSGTQTWLKRLFYVAKKSKSVGPKRDTLESGGNGSPDPTEVRRYEDNDYEGAGDEGAPPGCCTGALAKPEKDEKHNNYYELLNQAIYKFVFLDTKVIGAELTKDDRDITPIQVDFFDPGVLLTKADANMAFHDLMTWATICGYLELAEFFWQAGGDSINNAVFASVLFDRLGKSESMRRISSLTDMCNQMIKNGRRFEELACGVVGVCQVEDSEMTRLLLQQPINSLRITRYFKDPEQLDVITLAKCAEAISFLSQGAVIQDTQESWYGELTVSNQVSTMIMHIFFAPFDFAYMPSLFFRIEFKDKSLNGAHTLIGRRTASAHYVARLTAFYSTPLVKYYFHCLSCLSQLALCIIVTLGPLDGAFSAPEWYLAWWMVFDVIDHLPVFFKVPNLKLWFSLHWHELESFIYVFYWLATALRIPLTMPGATNSAQEATQLLRLVKIVYGMMCVVFLVRMMRFYFYSANVGPKIVMIQKMANDLIAFFSLLLVLLIAYGVFVDVLLHPFANRDTPQQAWSVIYRPAFQMFGELFLEDLDVASECIGQRQFTACGESHHALLPIVTWAYAMLSNVVLVNLLIAMMGQTYDRVETEADQQYRLQSRDLLTEYKEKQMVPPPFSWIFVFKQLYDSFKNRDRQGSMEPLKNATVLDPCGVGGETDGAVSCCTSR